MPKKLIVANWKMYLNAQQASLLIHRLDRKLTVPSNLEIVLAPGHLTLQPVSREIDRRKFRLAAQDGYFVDEGAYTGEVSFSQMRELVHYSIIGHSERRRYFNESLEVVRDKVAAAIRNGITPILCVGETREERSSKETKQVLHDQVVTALSNLTAEDIDNMAIAYEPVWAIGGDTPAKPDEIERALKWIRFQVSELYGDKVANNVRLLYGGSVQPDFVPGLMAINEVNGLLVGHESLNWESFTAVVKAAAAVSNKKAKVN